MMYDRVKLLAHRIEMKVQESLEPDTSIELDDVFNAAYDVLLEAEKDGE